VKLTADKITSQVAKGLAPIYFVCGDEPLLVGETIDTIRAAARQQGYDERESHSADARFDWTGLREGLNNMSLFASRKIVEIRLATGKPGRQGGAAIVELVADPPPDTLIIISSPQIDKRTSSSKWAQALERDAVWVTIRALPPERLPAWIAQRMRAQGLAADDEALEILAQRVEGNLLAAQQEISKLALLADGQRITADFIRESVADGARFDVYQLADAAMGQDVTRAVRILYGLRSEGVAPALTLWALVREANALISVWTKVEQGVPAGRAMNEARIWRARQPLLARALKSHTEASVRRLASSAGVADRIVKGARLGQPWNALLELVLLIARPGRPALAGYEL
jgi:DNA polymerase-3 subunit delta